MSAIMHITRPISEELYTFLSPIKSTMMFDPKDAFYLSVLSQLHWREVAPFLDEGRALADMIPWAGVTLDELILNPAGLMGLDPDIIRAIFRHEAEHIMRDEHNIREGKDATIWNVAADLLINESQFIGGVYGSTITRQFADRHLCTFSNYIDRGWLPHDAPSMDTEQIYHLLLKVAQDSAQARDQMSQHAGDDMVDTPTDGSDDQDGEEANKKRRAVILDGASRMAEDNHPGSTPADILKELEELKDPSVNWQELLTAVMDTVSVGLGDDMSFLEPDESYAGTDFIMPDSTQPSLGEVVVAVDTSGSVLCRGEILTRLMSEFAAVLDQYNVDLLHLIEADCRVRKVTTFHDPADFHSLHFSSVGGGGGTSADPVFKWMEDNGKQGCLLLYLTDGEIELSSQYHATASDVIWLVANTQEGSIKIPDVGMVVHAEI